MKNISSNKTWFFSDRFSILTLLFCLSKVDQIRQSFYSGFSKIFEGFGRNRIFTESSGFGKNQKTNIRSYNIFRIRATRNQTQCWEYLSSSRVIRGRYDSILSLSLRVVEWAEVLPEFLETSGDIRNFGIFLFFHIYLSTFIMKSGVV